MADCLETNENLIEEHTQNVINNKNVYNGFSEGNLLMTFAIPQDPINTSG